MLSLNASTLVLVIAVTLFTAACAFTDFTMKRIPNKLTLPMFFAGWIYQLYMSITDGWHHFGSAILGFAVGFGLLFVLWMVGGGGGGDVKLMGALSVWLGFTLTLQLLIVSTILVLIGTTGVVFWNVWKSGARKTREKYVAKGNPLGRDLNKMETIEDVQAKQSRRVMTYAGPVALATWLVLGWNIVRPTPVTHEVVPATPVHEEPAGGVIP